MGEQQALKLCRRPRGTRMALLHPSTSYAVPIPTHGPSSAPQSPVPRASLMAALAVTLQKDQALSGSC